MNCNFGPYQITTKLEVVNENIFVDISKSKQVVVFGDCNSIVPPCADAVALKRQNDCPQCDIAWFDCPSIMGREYTLLATPCGVTITSFSDGLISLRGCDATIFGSDHFCFGYIYSSAGKFKSNDESSVSFTFDGHEFSVRGNLGICSDDMFACGECLSNELVTAFADLPTPPPNPSAPSVVGDDTEKEAGVDDIPATETIPSESRSTWTGFVDPMTFGEAFCEPIERQINSGESIGVVDWGDTVTNSGGKALLADESNDNPSIATLPSGHTIIAYEHRGVDGLTKISLAILSSSVHRNIRYYRSLSRGVLLNNLSRTEGEAHFEVFDEIGEISPATLSIGFLTGPLKGTITPVRSVSRTVDGSRIKHLFKFSTTGLDVVFPDKNNTHDVGWFLSDSNEEGSEDLPPPGVKNVTTILNLPDHKSGGTIVPVAHPSIAVAQNNLMTMSEQNIYITYQAFEGNEWRVYLREILLGNKVGDNPPTYLAPYLFEEGSQRQIEIMQTIPLSVQSFGLGVNLWNEDFGKSSISRIGTNEENWTELSNVRQMPVWQVRDGQQTVSTTDTSVYYCDPDSLPDALRPCSTDTPSAATCIGVWHSITDGTRCSVGEESEDIQTYTRAFAVKAGDVPVQGEIVPKDVAITMRFAIIGNGLDPGEDTFPEIWFTFGKSNPLPETDEHADGWRLQILRGKGSITASSGVAHDEIQNTVNHTMKSCALGCNRISSACFIFRLYDGLDRPFAMRNQYDFDRSSSQDDDIPVREIWKCVDTIGEVNDYVVDTGWNEWRVETYLRGKKRIFDIYLNNFTTGNADVLMASFQEWDVEELRRFHDFLNTFEPHHQEGAFEAHPEAEFGKFHGFGHFHGNNSNQLIFDRIRADELLVPTKGSVSSIIYEDDMTADEHYAKQLFPATLDFNSELPKSFSYYLYSHNPSSVPGYGPERGNVLMKFVNSPSSDDTFYNSNIVYPSYRGTHAELRFTDVHASFFGIAYIDVTTDDWGNSEEEFNDISMTLSVARTAGGEGAWPHVWFLLRLENRNSKWWNGYRIRISRFTAQNQYAPTMVDPLGQTLPHGGSRPLIEAGSDWWRLQFFLPLPGATGGGVQADNLYEEIYIEVTGDVPDWVDVQASKTLTHPQAHIWPYFKVDTTVETGENGSFIRFKLYVGSDVEGNHTFDEATFTLLHTFDAPTGSAGSGARNPVYGFAIFDGHKDESELDGNPYPAAGFVNYVKLEKLVTEPMLGACCYIRGGCANTFQADCSGEGDRWTIGTTCGDDDDNCFPVGSVCGTSCVDNITEFGATEAMLGTCEGCDWAEGLLCEDRVCPEPTGSCCRPYLAAGCVDDLTRAECGVFFGNAEISPGAYNRSFNCDIAPCHVVEVGRCCLPSGCEVLSLSQCDARGGSSWILYSDCVSNPCAGACCDGTSCSQTDQLTCDTQGFAFLGYDIPCFPTNPTNPCADPDPIGACCHSDNSCTEIIESSCTENGTWFYETVCEDEPCPTELPTGACCNGDTGGCDDLTEVDCNALPNRLYMLNGSTCELTNCPLPTGACCNQATDECTGPTTSASCVSSGGIYQGNFTNCIDDICQTLGLLTGLGDNPYVNTSITFKPEDLWKIETGDEEYVTRVLYHMQEEILVSSSRVNESGESIGVSQVDFMFVIDHSLSMRSAINIAQNSVSALAEDFLARGYDVRFGFVVAARSRRFGDGPIPVPDRRIDCRITYIFDGLQATLFCDDSPIPLIPNTTGFTRNIERLRLALDCWGVQGGETAPWIAIRYAISEDQGFEWRDDAEKFMLFMTDNGDQSGTIECGDIENNKAAAKEELIAKGVKFIPTIDTSNTEYVELFSDVAIDSGWTGGNFNVNDTDYSEIFNTIMNEIDIFSRTDHATVIERAVTGIDQTFLKKAEIIITYDGDLSDLWTFNKSDFEFLDNHVPFEGTNTKGLVNFPFTLAGEQIYGIESVHIQGVQSNWVSFGEEGPLNYSHPEVGFRGSAVGDPILVSTNSSRPKVFVNNRNQVIVAYENYSSGTPNIELKGTGDFHQDSITGPKASRVQRFVTPNDFAYSHAITLPTTTMETVDSSDPYNPVEGTNTTTGMSDGLNQLCDFIIDNSDITHIVWQSNSRGYWEIYYANSSNMFVPVQVTKSDSRSSHPSISVDEEGSIFVVYHDDRFGPFNIMLASKDEERVIPLLEQDAYLASLKHKYTHYTNILPVLLDNPSGEVPAVGQFWGSKISEDSGNDQENAVYKINESSGIPSSGNVTTNSQHNYLAFSSTSLYSVDLEGTLFKLAAIEDGEVLFFTTPETIGTVEKDVSFYVDHRILDMTVDNFDRIWVLIYEAKSTVFVQNRLRIIKVSPIDASTLVTGIVFDIQVDTNTGTGNGSITVTSDNQFHITFEQGSNNVVSSANYPLINETVATFEFSDPITFVAGSDLITAMAHDVDNILWIVTSGNDLYTLNSTTGATAFQTSLTSPSGAEVALPVGSTSGIAFQDVDMTVTGADQFFHIRIDFYDNIALEGEPFLIVDSRENLEAFINEQILDDPYAVDVQGMDARGAFLALDQTGVVFFDVSHFVPGFTNLSQPYTFEPNQTYFVRVSLIPATGTPRESAIDQNSSFSCSKCSRFGNNNFNSSSCSYSFVSRNDSDDDLFFNYQIDFYADSGKQHIIRRFEAKPGSGDLAYMEVDNKTATSEWGDNGLLIVAGGAKFVQIHPVLDPESGFLCGVQYAVHVNQCLNIDSECTDYVALSAGKWDSQLVIDSSQNIKTNVDSSLIPDIPGLSMSTLDGNIIVAWVDNKSRLHYAEYDGKSWETQAVPVSGKVKFCSINPVNNIPAISYELLESDFSDVITFDRGKWVTYPGLKLDNSLAQSPSNLIDVDGLPVVVFTGNGGIHHKLIGFDTRLAIDTSNDLNNCGYSGGCIVSIASIGNTPVVGAVASNTIRFSQWGRVREFDAPLNDIVTFFPSQSIVSPDNVVPGKIGLTEIDGQPAIAYLRNEGDKQRLIYRRFDGSNWKPRGTLVELNDFNKHVALGSVNDQPAIAYLIKVSATKSQLWVAFFNGVFFVNDLVDEIDGGDIDPLLDIVQFGTGIALVVSANPFKIYIFRQFASSDDSQIHPSFFCDCSSKIFTNRLTHLHEVSRWEASAHGFSDTQVTDSTSNSLRPVIKTRPSGAAIILWEDKDVTTNISSIRAATFRNSNQDQLRGSGTGSWFDYDFGILGQEVSLSLDLYDRVNAVYETAIAIPPNAVDKLPRNELRAKVCDFSPRTSISSGGVGDESGDPSCNISKLENNVISFDQFVSEKIVRKIRVKDKDVSYYTYNASGVLTPIVSSCNITLEIHGTPEIVAVRLRGEGNAGFSPWCAWSPQIGDYMMEKEHKISRFSGIKEVCVQAMTYNGITTEFCLPIVADYETVVFETRFYSNINSLGEDISIIVDGKSDFTEFAESTSESNLVLLPLSEGISVANLAPIIDGATGVPATLENVLRNDVTILVEIIPNQTFEDPADITFDVIQQGSDDIFGKNAKKGINEAGRVVYRGSFVIRKEDNVSNIDGLARINPNFPNSCETSGSGASIETTFAWTRDGLNIFGQQVNVETSNVVDALVDFRQSVSGQVGVSVDIRSDEDPYFIFGDPNYSLKKTDGKQMGVPFNDSNEV